MPLLKKIELLERGKLLVAIKVYRSCFLPSMKYHQLYMLDKVWQLRVRPWSLRGLKHFKCIHHRQNLAGNACHGSINRAFRLSLSPYHSKCELLNLMMVSCGIKANKQFCRRVDELKELYFMERQKDRLTLNWSTSINYTKYSRILNNERCAVSKMLEVRSVN